MIDTTTGNAGLDALADAIAKRVLAKLHEGEEPRLLSVKEAAAYIGRTQKSLSLHDRRGRHSRRARGVAHPPGSRRSRPLDRNAEVQGVAALA